MKVYLPLGTLIFQVQETKDAFNDAVSRSCSNLFYRNNIINHVGILVAENIIAEATFQAGVQCISLDTFLSKGALNKAAFIKNDIPIKDVITKVYSCLGQPYNASFYPDSEGYYCSELITEAFNTVVNNRFFELYSMNFRDKTTDTFIPFWVEYFYSLGCPIPQGILGSHPFKLYQQQQFFKEIYIL